ncbi:hypothetical protein PMm318_A36090 [Pseudomonas moorei]
MAVTPDGAPIAVNASIQVTRAARIVCTPRFFIGAALKIEAAPSDQGAAPEGRGAAAWIRLPRYH